MGVLACDTKKVVRSVVLTVALYVLVIAISTMTIVKPAQASFTISATLLFHGGQTFCSNIRVLERSAVVSCEEERNSGPHGYNLPTTCVDAAPSGFNGQWPNWMTCTTYGMDQYGGRYPGATYVFVVGLYSQYSCQSGYVLNTSTNACTLPSNTPDPNKNIGLPKNGCCQGNPVNAGSGNKYQAEIDYSGTGPFPLRMERYYNSGGTIPSAVDLATWGSQWRGFYNRSVAYATNGMLSTAVVRRAGGKQYFYNWNGTGFVGDADVDGLLIRLGVNAYGFPTGWTYTNEKDEIETYDGVGRLVSITNRAGLVQTLTYSDGTAGSNGGYILDSVGAPTTTILPAGLLIRVTDPAGRSLQFGYDVFNPFDSTSRVNKITDPDGHIYLYTYSGPATTDNLASVKYPDGAIRTYLYGETANVSSTPNTGVSYAHDLTGIVDENGTRYASWTYDAAGRATSSEHGAFGSGIDKY